VRQFAHVLSRLTTTERPSFATVNATHLTPASRHLMASELRIGREALARSVSPRQNRSKPPPVPEMPTVIRTPRFFFWKPSAAAAVYGPSVLEPSAVMLPLSAFPPAVAVAAATASSTAASAAGARTFFMCLPCRRVPSCRAESRPAETTGGLRDGEQLVGRR
jgi:hypothetical protein